MCVSIEFNGKEIDDIGDLKSICPKIISLNGAEVEEDSFGSCLCGIDVERTAQVNGLVAKRIHGSMMDYEFFSPDD